MFLTLHTNMLDWQIRGQLKPYFEFPKKNAWSQLYARSQYFSNTDPPVGTRNIRSNTLVRSFGEEGGVFLEFILRSIFPDLGWRRVPQTITWLEQEIHLRTFELENFRMKLGIFGQIH